VGEPIALDTHPPETSLWPRSLSRHSGRVLQPMERRVQPHCPAETGGVTTMSTAPTASAAISTSFVPVPVLFLVEKDNDSSRIAPKSATEAAPMICYPS
jgi:hypothetical protein